MIKYIVIFAASLLGACGADARLEAGDSAKLMGIASYAISETANSTEVQLLGRDNKRSGRIVITNRGALTTAALMMDDDGKNVQLELRRGEFSVVTDDEVIGHFTVSPDNTAAPVVIENLEPYTYHLLALGTTLNDPNINAVLERRLGRCVDDPGAIACLLSARISECPWYVNLTACGTCIACFFVAEIPPPCWAACATCGGCLGVPAGKAAAEWCKRHHYPRPCPRP